MLQSVCIDPGQTAVLEMGKRYFLFPNGSHNYYVSNFPNPNAHKGCFQAKYFQIVEKEERPQEPTSIPVSLDSEKTYRANLIWRKPGYKMVELKEYYVKPGKTHGDFYHDNNFKQLVGCFPLHWFSNFEEIILDIIDQEVPDFDIDFEENEPLFIESEPKITKYEQLSFFDF